MDSKPPSARAPVADKNRDGTIVFIGGGNMARSLIGGMIARGTPAGSIYVAEPNSDARDALAATFGVHVGADNAAAAAQAGTLVLAVKPQVMANVCAGIREHLPEDAVVVSIAAGITSAQVDAWLGGDRAVVRSMPNTPALLGLGATGLFANAAASEAQMARAEALMASVGITVRIANESQMDAVTALSGSGPAYVFLLAEAMQAGAQAAGLPEPIAQQLTAQTLLGAAHMLSDGNEAAAELRARVTSPGGTTQAAVHTLQAGGFEALVAQAIHSATRRGQELAAAAAEAK